MDLQESILGVKRYLDKEYFVIKGTTIYISQEVEEEMCVHRDNDCLPFDHCLIDQIGEGDYVSGVAYFHLTERQYLVVEY